MPTTLPTVRPLDYADLPELQSIRQAAFAPAFRSYREIVGDPIAMHVFARADTEQAELLASVCEPGSGHDVIVAVVGDALAGFASYKADPLARLVEIGLNAVHPRFAGHGVGTLMCEHVLAGMKEAGMIAATVSTGATRAIWQRGALTPRPASRRDCRPSISIGHCDTPAIDIICLVGESYARPAPCPRSRPIGSLTNYSDGIPPVPG